MTSPLLDSRDTEIPLVLLPRAGTSDSNGTNLQNTAAITPSWHPKLTGSRLFVILTTLALGTAKGIAAFRGKTVVPVTIEWVTATIFFTM